MKVNVLSHLKNTHTQKKAEHLCERCRVRRRQSRFRVRGPYITADFLCAFIHEENASILFGGSLQEPVQEGDVCLL